MWCLGRFLCAVLLLSSYSIKHRLAVVVPVPTSRKILLQLSMSFIVPSLFSQPACERKCIVTFSGLRMIQNFPQSYGSRYGFVDSIHKKM
jgi:hypothetical protein